DFLPSSEYDSFLSEDFSKVDALPLTNNEDKNAKKQAISHATLILKDFDPPLNELPSFKEVPKSNILLSFSSKNEEKVQLWQKVKQEDEQYGFHVSPLEAAVGNVEGLIEPSSANTIFSHSMQNFECSSSSDNW
nr:hypothetical protein [Tanacetum cinerariifolium]